MNILKQVKNLVSDSTSSSSGGQEEWFITAERAEGVSDLGGLSKSDPYLKIEFGGKHVQTRVIKNDRSPAWNETFNFKLKSGSAKEIVLKLVDQDIGLDDTIGTATIRKDELPSYSGEEKYLKVPILRKDQVNGIVHLRVKKIVDGQHGQQFQQQQFQQQPNYNQQQPNYNQQQPNYNQQQPNYNQQQPNYNQQQPNYNQQQPNYSQQQPNYSQQSMNPSQPYQPQQQQQQFNSNSNYYGQQRH